MGMCGWVCVCVCVCTCACVGVRVRAYVLVCLCACECVGDLVWACVHLVWGATLGVSWMGAHVYKCYCVSRAHGIYLADLQVWR